jgi:hypothetical protein
MYGVCPTLSTLCVYVCVPVLCVCMRINFGSCKIASEAESEPHVRHLHVFLSTTLRWVCMYMSMFKVQCCVCM